MKLAFLTVGVILLAGAALVGVARLFGKSGSRLSVLVSVIAHWLGAYALWNLVGGLALHYGALRVYDSTPFAVLALVLGVWHYRARVRRGDEQGLAIFVGGQLAWLLIVLARNGLFAPPS